MNTPYNGIGYGSMDWSSLMSNPYFLAALNSPNVNFKSTQAASNVQSADLAQAAAAMQSASDGAIPVNYAETTPDESNTGLWVTGAIGAAALIACMAKGGGNPVKGAKAWYEKFFKSAGNKASDTVKTALTKIRAVKNGNNEIRLNVPNKTKTFAGNQINTGVNEYGIGNVISAERQAFNPQESVLRGFQLNTPIGKYTVFMDNGKVSKVIEGHKDVYARLTEAKEKTTDAELRDTIIKAVEELGKNPKDADKSILKNVANIGYVNKYGDDTLKLTIGKYGETPKLKALTTLEQFTKDAEAVKKYVPSETEKIYIGDLTQKTGVWGHRKTVLADGMGVLKCEKKIGGAECFFEGDKLVKVVEGENTYTADSFGFIKFVEKNTKEIEKFKKAVFEDKLYDEIPIGATIGHV